ncbi:hypothetical protein INT43_003694 [Umbelopsis isabellina]|uniref:Uncharacterized protein n=1 Tax=Mortierella isabellina TaxID=91625 RepID=A0A8H7PU56_MORIS|nr:hypothetical protein INT43_003694 [Umbelopsis isabellina]
MPTMADSNRVAHHTIKVITPENLSEHLRPAQQHYDTLLSPESSPLLSPPPPYRQYEQDTDHMLDTLQISRTRITDIDRYPTPTGHMNADLCNSTHSVESVFNLPIQNCHCDSDTTCLSCSNPAPLEFSLSPSASTPIHCMRTLSNDVQHDNRQRRHSTSVRSENTPDSTNSEDQDSQTLDRISVILSHLLKEASDAVNGLDSGNKNSTSVPAINNNRNINSPSTKTYDTKDSTRASRSPKKSRIQLYAQTSEPSQSIYSKSLLKSKAPHRRTNSDVRYNPNEESSSVDNAKRRSTGSIAKPRWSRGAGLKDATQLNSTAQRCSNGTNLSRSLPNRSCNSQPNSPKQTRISRRRTLLNEPLLESYRRVDDSLALVDSLSRDLASNTTTTDFQLESNEGSKSVNQKTGDRATLKIDDTNQSMSLVAFLMVQAIHSVLAFCSGLLSLKTTGITLEALESSAFYNALSWAFTYTMGNVLVDQCIQKAPAQVGRRLTIPGEYKSRSPSPVPASHNQVQSFQSRKQRRIANPKAIGHLDQSLHREASGLDCVVPTSSQSLSLLERRSGGKNSQGESVRKSDKIIERLVLPSPTRKLYQRDEITDDESDQEQEVLQVLAVKRIKKRGSVKYKGVPILERRNST